MKLLTEGNELDILQELTEEYQENIENIICRLREQLGEAKLYKCAPLSAFDDVQLVKELCRRYPLNDARWEYKESVITITDK